MVYLLRWQLSTPILAVCVLIFAPLGNIWSTVIANFIGGLIFFWIDRKIFLHKISIPEWHIENNVQCADCGIIARGYRLVKANKYDKLEDPNPEYRCEKCSEEKFKNMKIQ